jgi:hypothetical protein
MSSEANNLPVPVSAPRSSDAPASSMLVDVGGHYVRGELRRMQGVAPRFSLTIANDAPLFLLVSFRVRRRGADRAIAPGEIWMDPHSHADLVLKVPPGAWLGGGTLVVRLINAQLRHELVAPLTGSQAVIAACAGGAAVVAAAATFAFAQPRIDAFAVPPVSVATGTLRVPYRVSGIGTPSYALQDDRGSTIASGTLRDREGTLQLQLPVSARARNYALSLRDAGALGSAQRSEPVTALPSATAPPRQLIEALAVDDAQVSDGGRVTVHYRTTATSGRITVIDDRNTVWAQAPLSRGGFAQLSLPQFGRNEQLRVRLDARRGFERASSTVGLNVVAPTPSPSSPPADVAQAPSADAAEAPVSIPEQQANAGQQVHASIAPGAHDVHLAIETVGGATLASVDVPKGQTEAAITIPRSARGRLVVVATYDIGLGEESIVRAIDVH